MVSREKLDDDDDDEEDDDDSEDEEDPDGRVIKGRKREEGVEKGARRVPAREREREGQEREAEDKKRSGCQIGSRW